ncbi:putative myristylated membrane protein 2 [Diachasmimorpha longicaudata entomopoxvirus]|uniref:Putative myristylated membrane protein 2 n=1 Tax=Diachasmimorpha longicaudata entomopoxvirus TaxID=109981 RepID=A0A7R5WJ69_9POXV|nr:putative myristylated membrane protein 2 [Diachasmimorpha longicaudata entomopoxvirus]AKS26353.1 putative myristylated membrane protein 2 [Diachasmimorpha longicaudata entomopoxvirus]
MGGSHTKFERDHRVWGRNVTEEDVLPRADHFVMASYPLEDRIRQGRNKHYSEFKYVASEHLQDAQRRMYKGNATKCCLGAYRYERDQDDIFTCDPQSLDPQGVFCNEIMEKHCLEDDFISKCFLWIPSAVDNVNSPIHTFCKDETRRNDKRCQIYYTSMRETSMKHSAEIDAIFNEFSEEVKKEYLCMFPPASVLEDQKKTVTPYECWYKPCVLSPISELSSQNISKRQQCKLTICDIHIQELKTKKSDIQIACNKVYTKTDLIGKDSATFIDKETLFSVPDFDVFLPALIVLLFVYI